MFGQKQKDANSSFSDGSPPIQKTRRRESSRNVSELLDFAPSLGGIFDEAFDVYKRHFGALAWIVSIVVVPVQILMKALDAMWLRPLSVQLRDVFATTGTAKAFMYVLLRLLIGAPDYGVPGVLSLAATVIISAPVAIAIGDIFVGRRPSARLAYQRTWRFFLPLLLRYAVVGCAFVGTWLLASLAVLMVLVLLSLIAGLLTTVVPAAATGFGIVSVLALTLVPFAAGCAMIARFFAFTTPLTVMERLSFSRLITRSDQLIGKKRFVRTWVVVMLLPIVTFGLQGITLASLHATLGAMHLSPWTQFALVTVASTSIIYLLQPYWVICLTLLYYDYRIQRDGLDLHILADSLSGINQVQMDHSDNGNALDASVAVPSPILKETL